MCELLKSWLRANAGCNSLPEEEVRCVGKVGLSCQHGREMQPKIAKKNMITLRYSVGCIYGKIAIDTIIVGKYR